MKQIVIFGCGVIGLVLCVSAQAQNTVGGTSTGSGVGSGQRNLIYNSLYARIGGGFTNVIVSGANFSTIGGGYSNAVSAGATFATVGGGSLNLVSATSATVAGGQFNKAISDVASVGGGFANTAGGIAAAVGGGDVNTAVGMAATVGGGQFNIASGERSTVGGGQNNDATGLYATVPGGFDNEATASDTFAAGASSRATNTGSFVWSGDFSVATASTNDYSFTVRATGGARFLTTTNLVGVTLPSGGTAWAVLSDSNAKTGVHAINPRQILAKVAALPVTSWQYKHDPRRTYIGPMAQDFHAAFGLGGDDDKTITTLDTDGVTLAAIQGLVQELNDVRAENAEMREELREVREMLNALPPAP